MTKGRDYCLGWTSKVVTEFFAQGDLEKDLKLPVTPFMDRSTACIPKQQIGFYNFVARPMFEAMDALIPMTGALNNLDTMYEYWSAQLPDDEPPPSTTPASRRPSASTPPSSTGSTSSAPHTPANDERGPRLSRHRLSRAEGRKTSMVVHRALERASRAGSRLSGAIRRESSAPDAADRRGSSDWTPDAPPVARAASVPNPATTTGGASTVAAVPPLPHGVNTSPQGSPREGGSSHGSSVTSSPKLGASSPQGASPTQSDAQGASPQGASPTLGPSSPQPDTQRASPTQGI